MRAQTIALFGSIFLCLVVVSCSYATSEDGKETVFYNELLGRNRSNLPRLEVGMTRADVISLMGVYHGSKFSNPFQTEALAIGDDRYEILYYLTQTHPGFRQISIAQATPIVLKDGRLVGWGRSALNYIRPAR